MQNRSETRELLQLLSRRNLDKAIFMTKEVELGECIYFFNLVTSHERKVEVGVISETLKINSTNKNTLSRLQKSDPKIKLQSKHPLFLNKSQKNLKLPPLNSIIRTRVSRLIMFMRRKLSQKNQISMLNGLKRKN
jgi:hypothetical protein